MSKVNYELITIAREIEGYTQKSFSEALGIKQGTISKIENGLLNKITDDFIQKVAEVLKYPVEFFYQDWKPIRVEGHYRRKASETVKAFKETKAKMTLAERHFNILTQHIEVPQANYPTWDLTTDGNAALCARHVREYWKVPKGRINNVTELLETNGFVIIELDLGETTGFSCFSKSGVPLIFINKNISPDRYRLTVTHEAFHFILHHGQKISAERDFEAEAFESSSEFLAPLHELEGQLSRLTLAKLADLKAYWKLSMQALLVKASKSEVITRNQSEYLWKQLTAAGYRKKEPVEIAREYPTVFKEILNAHFEDFEYTKEEVETLLNFNKISEWYLNQRRSLKIVRKTA
jgi:Zn-dependent peptidase ImmA (M78 family)/DNA-binding XRE family transcriptional regulator